MSGSWDTSGKGSVHPMPGMPAPGSLPKQLVPNMLWNLRKAALGQYIPCGHCVKPVFAPGKPMYGWITPGTPYVLCCPCAETHYGAPHVPEAVLTVKTVAVTVVSHGYTHRCIECSLVRCAGEGHRCEECAENIRRTGT